MPHNQHIDSVWRTRFAHWVLWSLAAAFILGLFNHGLVPSMEPRFAEVVREMIDTGEWLVPIKNGRPYVEYPVFYYWLAIVGKLLGLPMTVAIRLPSYLAFFAWLYLLNRWQSYIAPKLSPLAFVIAGAAMPLVLFQFSIAQTDSVLILGVLLAMFGYSKFVANAEPGNFPWMLWLGVALATLAKGPVGIACTLPVFFLDRVIAGIGISRQRGTTGIIAALGDIARSLLPIAWLRGMAIVLIATAPWYVIAGLTWGWKFIEAVLVYQNVDRYVTGYSHAQPWWYYCKTIIYDFFPASLLAPVGIWVAARSKQTAQARLVLIWAIFTFVFFSVSGSKQGKYLLPAAPAIIALSFFAIEALKGKYNVDLWRWLKGWYLGVILCWALLVAFVVPFYSGKFGGVDGFELIKQQLSNDPGRIVHYQWPRSLTLYELGAPMPFVRSARELYGAIRKGNVRSGDYVIIAKSLLGNKDGSDRSVHLLPYPDHEVFEQILETEIDQKVVLLRVKPGADTIPQPETPEPPTIHWRDKLFDTD